MVDTPAFSKRRDGRQRETNARQRAARADLLILVVTGSAGPRNLEVFEASPAWATG